MALILVAQGGAFAQDRIGAPIFDFAAGASYDSNLSNAVAASDRESEIFLQAAFGATWSYRPQRDWTLRWRPLAEVALASRYDDFSHAGAGLDAGIAYKAGLGHLAPRFELGMVAQYQMFNNDDLSRMGWEPSLHYHQRFNDRFGWELFYAYDMQNARGSVFDGDGQTGGLVLRYEPGGSWSFLLGYQIRQGDVVSFATPPQPGIVAQARFITPGFTGFDRPMTAYRLDAVARTLQVGAAYALSDTMSLECIYDWRTTAEDNLHYDAHIIQFGIRANF